MRASRSPNVQSDSSRVKEQSVIDRQNVIFVKIV